MVQVSGAAPAAGVSAAGLTIVELIMHNLSGLELIVTNPEDQDRYDLLNEPGYGSVGE